MVKRVTPGIRRKYMPKISAKLRAEGVSSLTKAKPSRIKEALSGTVRAGVLSRIALRERQVRLSRRGK